jgi:hypothetical protein
MPGIGFLKHKEEPRALAALTRLEVGRRNEVVAVFTQFAKSTKGTFVSYFDMFPTRSNLMVSLRCLGKTKNTKTFTSAMSWRFS